MVIFMSGALLPIKPHDNLNRNMKNTTYYQDQHHMLSK